MVKLECEVGDEGDHEEVEEPTLYAESGNLTGKLAFL